MTVEERLQARLKRNEEERAARIAETLRAESEKQAREQEERERAERQAQQQQRGGGGGGRGRVTTLEESSDDLEASIDAELAAEAEAERRARGTGMPPAYFVILNSCISHGLRGANPWSGARLPSQSEEGQAGRLHFLDFIFEFLWFLVRGRGAAPIVDLCAALWRGNRTKL